MGWQLYCQICYHRLICLSHSFFHIIMKFLLTSVTCTHHMLCTSVIFLNLQCFCLMLHLVINMSGKYARTEYLDEIEKRSSLITFSDARTVREYTGNLNINATPPVVRGTGIVCTIGKRCFLFPHFYFEMILQHAFKC